MSDPTCGFCGDDAAHAWHLLAGPGIAACDRCVVLLRDIVAASDGGPSASAPTDGPFSTCAFCGAGAHEVALVVGSERHGDVDPVICHDCVRLCVEVLEGRGVPLADPWFAALRAQPWIRPAGAPVDAADWARALAAALAGRPAGAPDAREVADAVGDLARDRRVVLGYDDARALAEAALAGAGGQAPR